MPPTSSANRTVIGDDSAKFAEFQLVGDEEYIVLAPFPIAGNQYFEGDVDDRPRCKACREPVELDDPDVPDSWIHCEDANDLGDHTAER